MKIFKYFAVIALLVAVTGCRVKSTQDNQQAEASSEAHDHSNCEHNHDSHDGHDHSDSIAAAHSHSHDHAGDGGCSHSHDNMDNGDEADEIVFTRAQAELTDFEVEKVRRVDFREVIKCGGRIEAAQGQQVSIVAPISGIVAFSGKTLVNGAPISSGQKLFSISTKNIDLGGGDIFLRTRSAYEKAKMDYERSLALFEDRIISQRELADAELEYLQSKNEYESIAGTSSAGGAAVSAQLTGYLSSLTVQQGDYVEAGQLIGTIVQDRRLVLRAELSSRHYPKLNSLADANFVTLYDKAVYNVGEMNGRFVSASRSLPAGSSMLPVFFEFDNPGTLLSGSLVEVYLLGQAEKNVIVVPAAAITEQQGLYYVYIQLSDEHYQRREVKIGGNDGRYVKILSGLESGETIVTVGAVNVKMAANSGEIPHGHEH